MSFIPPSNPAGICTAKGWKLSVKQIKAKGCLNSKKQQKKYRNANHICPYFKRVDEHPVWIQVDTERAKKKAAKLAAKLKS